MGKRINLKNLIIVFLVGFFCFSFFRQETAMKRLNKQMADKQQALEDLKNDNEKLKQEVEKVKSSNDEFIEKMVRERLGLIKPGEKVVNNTSTK
ncbi:MAG: septum formation initiator family protein [Clostridiaceae bacterium]